MSTSFQKKISVTRLRVNPNNVRYEGAAKDQHDAIRRIIVEQGRKFVNLCKHIAKHGLEPGRSVYVHAIVGTRDYLLLDGNRRVSAIKVLLSKELQREFKSILPGNFGKIADEFVLDNKIDSVDCSVFNLEEDAREWIAVNHGFGEEGITTQDWNSDVRGKVMASYKKSKRQRDGLVLDYLRETDLTDEAFKARLKDGQINNTALRRFLSEDTIPQLGLSFADGQLSFNASQKEIVKTLVRVVTDLIGKAIKTKDVWDEKARGIYLGKLREEGYMPDLSLPVDTLPEDDQPETVESVEADEQPKNSGETAGATQEQPQTDGMSIEVPSESDVVSATTTSSESTDQDASDLDQAKPAYTKPRPIVRSREYVFSKSLNISNRNSRIVDIYNELSRVKVTENPNAVAFLLRAFVEMLVKEYDKRHRIASTGKDATLREAVKRAVDHYKSRYGNTDSNDFRGIMEACEAGNVGSIFAIESFQQLVHREQLKPIPSEVITRWDNIEPAITHLLAKT